MVAPPDRAKLPRARATVIVQEQDDESYLLDTDGGEAFEVNATAARIFGFCQRELTVADAVRALASGVRDPDQEELIRQDVEDTVRQFEELGLLASATE